jgi:hypothetical protein
MDGTSIGIWNKEKVIVVTALGICVANVAFFIHGVSLILR